MQRIPERVPVREFEHHVSGGQPQGSRAEDPHPDPDEWGDSVETVTDGGILVAGDGGEVLKADTTRAGEGDCLVCGGPADPGFYLELETPGSTDHNIAGRVCETHARALAGLVSELERQAGETDA